MRKIISSAVCLLTVAALGGCKIINPSEPTPTYVQVDSFAFTGEQRGSSSHKITNVWAYFNNAPVGNFDLPARIPVLASTPGTLTLVPGIFYDGFSVYPVINPMYLADNSAFTPQPGQVIRYTPVTGYNTNVKLRFEDAFDNGSGAQNKFSKLGGDTTILNTTVPSEVFEGFGSGKVYLGPGDDSALVVSLPTDKIPAGQDAYIELDYMGTATMRVGLQSARKNVGDIYPGQIVGLNPRTTWGKVYIGVKEWIAANQSNDQTYQIFLRIDKLKGTNEAYMLVDNVKLVSF